MFSIHKTILPKKFAPKYTMSLGNPIYPTKGKLIYSHTINILHHSYHFLSPIQHAHKSLKSSISNTYKTKRPLYSTWLYKGLFLRYFLYFILSLFALTIRLRADTSLILPTTLRLSLSRVSCLQIAIKQKKHHTASKLASGTFSVL